jgi:hypothetical protein
MFVDAPNGFSLLPCQKVVLRTHLPKNQGFSEASHITLLSHISTPARRRKVAEPPPGPSVVDIRGCHSNHHPLLISWIRRPIIAEVRGKHGPGSSTHPSNHIAKPAHVPRHLQLTRSPSNLLEARRAAAIASEPPSFDMASLGDTTMPATRRQRKSIGGRMPSAKSIDKENATVDLGSTLAANRKKSRSKSIGPGGLDVLRNGSGNRRAV